MRRRLGSIESIWSEQLTDLFVLTAATMPYQTEQQHKTSNPKTRLYPPPFKTAMETRLETLLAIAKDH